MSNKNHFFARKISGKGSQAPANSASAQSQKFAAIKGALQASKNVKGRWGIVLLCLFVVIALTMGVASDDKKPQTENTTSAKASSAPLINTTPQNAEKELFRAQFSKDLEALRSEVNALKTEKEKAEARAAAAEARGASGSQTPAPPLPKDGTFQISKDFKLPPTTENPGATAPAITPPVITTPTKKEKTVRSFSFDEEKSNEASNGADPSSSRSPSGNDVETKTTYSKNKSAGLLPMGFASMELLHGVDANTSTATRSNPTPILMMITDNAILPGSAKYKLKNCFVTGSAYGDASENRVHIKLARIACTDKDRRLVLAQPVYGYVVDSDGTSGLRGELVNRRGSKLYATMLEFAHGMAGALGGAQGTVSSNSLVGQTTSMTGSAVLRASGFAGAQSAANQLADFFLKEAQSIFPVISVKAKKSGAVVFDMPVTLNWLNPEEQYTAEVTPTNK